LADPYRVAGLDKSATDYLDKYPLLRKGSEFALIDQDDIPFVKPAALGIDELKPAPAFLSQLLQQASHRGRFSLYVHLTPAKYIYHIKVERLQLDFHCLSLLIAISVRNP
jgi:hypothetical protein